jgi:hypothetical protein
VRFGEVRVEDIQKSCELMLGGSLLSTVLGTALVLGWSFG